MRFLRFFPALLALAALHPALADPLAAPAYTVTDLGTLGGSYSKAVGISPNGQVCGESSVARPYGGYTHGFLWSSPLGMRDLEGIGDHGGTAAAVNDAGQVAGALHDVGVYYYIYNSSTNSYNQYPATYGLRTGPDGQGLNEIAPYGGHNASLFAINASGGAVGVTGTTPPYNAFDGPQRGLLAAIDGSETLLSTLGGQTSAAYAINDSGLIAGAATLAPATSAYPQHAALWQNGQVTDLGTLGGPNSLAYGINATGQVVGASDIAAPLDGYRGQHPFLWQSGQMTDLGMPPGGSSGIAKGINLSGQVVGNGQTSLGNPTYPYPNGSQQVAMLWQGGQAYDLNTTLIGDTGWLLTDAAALNDSGLIVGSGLINGQTHAYLLTPVVPGTPRVGTLSPNRARVGDGPLTITISGSGFDTNAIAQWNGMPLATTYVSATQLTALVPAADLAAPTEASVTVVDASVGAVLGQLNFVVQPTNLLSVFSVSPSVILAGRSAFGSVTLSQPAGAGGYSVSLLSSSGLISYTVGEPINYPSNPPVTINTIIVPAGQTYAQFSLITTADPNGSAALPVTLTAQDGATALTQAITLDSLLLSSLTFSPSSLASGGSTTGTLTLSGLAPAGGLTVSLSTYTGAPVSFPATVTVPAAASSVTFPVTTTAVSYASSISISAAINGGSSLYQSISGSLTLLAGDVPSTSASYTGPSGIYPWYVGPITFTLTATDPSGPAAIVGTYYSMDNGPQQTYSGPFLVSAEGSHTLSYHSVNTAGSVEASNNITFKIDSTPPVSSASIYGNLLYLSASDAGSGVAQIYYSLDSSPFQPYFTGIALTQGKHSLAFYSVDNAGNREPTHTQLVVADTTFPTTTATQSAPTGKNGWSLASVTVTVSATDPDGAADVAATYYSIDGAPTQTYTAPFVVTGNAVHTVSFWSVDQAGNTETAHSITVLIDGMAPTLAFGVPTPARNAAGWNNTPVDIPFYYGDNGGSGMASSPVSPLHVVTEGNGQRFPVTLTDVAGNSATFLSPYVNLDMTAPVSTSVVKGAQVTLTASDSLSGVKATYYTLDGGAQQKYTAPITVSGAGNHTVVYWSVDAADNVETSHSLPVTIASPPPIPLVTQARYWPRAGCANRMVGGKFQGSLDGVNYTDLATITKTPPAGQWSALPITTTTSYLYLRYLAPAKSYGNIAELEFDTGSGSARTKMIGTPFGTLGSYQNSGNTFAKAFDGSPNTFFDAPAPGSGDFVGLTLSATP